MEGDQKVIETLGALANTMKEGDKFYVLRKTRSGRLGAAKAKLIFEEMDEKAYKKRIKGLAKLIGEQPGIKVEDIIEDALKDYNLNHIEEIEKMLGKEIARAERKEEEPKIKTKPGYCTEIMLGKRYSFVVRE